MSLICNFFHLIAKKSEIYKIPKWTQFWHEMLKIASVYDAPPDPLVAKGFLLSAIAALRLWHSQFELLARCHKHPPASRSQVFPTACRLLLFNCVELTNYGYFCTCIPCPPQ